jgi:apolipoprotein N-acyltransferase
MLEKIKSFFKSKFFIAFASGALCSLAFAPFYLVIFAIISIAIFYFLIDKSNNKKLAFYYGFFYGFGYFLAGNYWIAISLLVDADEFAWLIPFCLTLIPGVLALYFAFLAFCFEVIIKKFHFRENHYKITIFAVLWVIFEFLRSYLFTGFPWNLLGYSALFNEAFAQSANIFGVLGLSFLMVLIALLPLLFFKNNHKKPDKIFAAIIVVLALLNLIYGKNYISDEKLTINHEHKLRIVQANIKQEMKWAEHEKYRNFLKAISLTNSRNLDDIKTVIWAETSTPYAIEKNSAVVEKLKLAIPKNGSLITGALRFEHDSYRITSAWNSVFTLSENGIDNFYDKHHLVPFGEYVPLEEYLPFIQKITNGSIGFSKGSGPKTLEANGLKYSPLVCYEVIFFDKIIDKNDFPELLVNVTNDAWFGLSSGPFQHFDMARMRAIEYGISLVRSANTGISAFVDPFGRVIAKIGLNEEGIIDVDLITKNEKTIYATKGSWPLIWLLLAIIAIIFAMKKWWR